MTVAFASSSLTFTGNQVPIYPHVFPDIPAFGVPARPTIFYVEKDQPNVIFGAYRPETLFFPASGMKIDQFDSLRTVRDPRRLDLLDHRAPGARTEVLQPCPGPRRTGRPPS